MDKNSPEYAKLMWLYSDVGGVENIPLELLDYLPLHKSDDERAERVKTLSMPTVEPILLHLVSWLADLNWPVARSMVDFLLALDDDALIEPVRFALRSNDPLWKYWLLEQLIRKWPRERIEPIQEELRYLVTSPTGNERAEEIPELAQEILDKHGL